MGIGGPFSSITRAKDELSIVCLQSQVPPDVKYEGEFACLKLHGPFPLTQTGVLGSFIAPLAAAGIAVFALATFDTDYVLIHATQQARAFDVLGRAGHRLA